MKGRRPGISTALPELTALPALPQNAHVIKYSIPTKNAMFPILSDKVKGKAVVRYPPCLGTHLIPNTSQASLVMPHASECFTCNQLLCLPSYSSCDASIELGAAICTYHLNISHKPKHQHPQKKRLRTSCQTSIAQKVSPSSVSLVTCAHRT